MTGMLGIVGIHESLKIAVKEWLDAKTAEIIRSIVSAATNEVNTFRTINAIGQLMAGVFEKRKLQIARKRELKARKKRKARK